METELTTKWRLDQICEDLNIEKSTYYKKYPENPVTLVRG